MMGCDHLLAEIRPGKKKSSFFHTLPFPLAHGGGGRLRHPCVALWVTGSWEDAVPQAALGEGRSPSSTGRESGSSPSNKKLILAEVGRARQTSQAEFHSHE